MSIYLTRAHYSQESFKGMIAQPSDRQAASRAMFDAAGTAERVSEIGHAHYMARHIPDAKLVELTGEDHVPWIGDQETMLDEVEQFVTGLHTGECDRSGEKLAGIAVHTGARVAGLAAIGEVLVSQTVRDLVAGSGLTFEARGAHTLKGVPGTWQLFSVS